MLFIVNYIIAQLILVLIIRSFNVFFVPLHPETTERIVYLCEVNTWCRNYLKINKINI